MKILFKKQTLAALLSIFASLGSSAVALAEMAHIAAPSGATLPKDVIRTRLIYNRAASNFRFDSEGNKEDRGIYYRRNAGAVVLEFGATDRLSLQLKVPYVINHGITVDHNRFVTSSTFKEKFGLIESNIRKNPDVSSFNLSKESLPQSLLSKLELPTGESYKLPNGLNKDSATDYILSNLRSTKGLNGLADIELGALYNFYRDNSFCLSLGGGFRFPTGQFDAPKMAPGKQILDLGIKLTSDYSPVDGLWLTLENDFEHALTKGTYKRPSMLNPMAFNEAHPTDSASNEQTLEKRFLTHKLNAGATLGLGAIDSSLKMFAINARYKLNNDRPVYYNNQLAEERSRLHTFGGSFSVSGLPYSLPIELAVEYDAPIAGKNVEAAEENFLIVTKIYAKF